ncbi:MAG: S4 domain-containing protein, partial [Nitrospinota bacterium]
KIHPLEAKKRLGVEIVSIYHSREKAINARASFKKTFQQGKLPEKPQVFQIDSVNKEKNDLLSVVEHFTQSKTQAKRLIFNGAVDINGLPNKDPKQKVVSGDKIKIGKKDFIQVRY